MLFVIDSCQFTFIDGLGGGNMKRVLRTIGVVFLAVAGTVGVNAQDNETANQQRDDAGLRLSDVKGAVQPLRQRHGWTMATRAVGVGGGYSAVA